MRQTSHRLQNRPTSRLFQDSGHKTFRHRHYLISAMDQIRQRGVLHGLNQGRPRVVDSRYNHLIKVHDNDEVSTIEISEQTVVDGTHLGLVVHGLRRVLPAHYVQEACLDVVSEDFVYPSGDAVVVDHGVLSAQHLSHLQVLHHQSGVSEVSVKRREADEEVVASGLRQLDPQGVAAAFVPGR